jgi:hypothetical protein
MRTGLAIATNPSTETECNRFPSKDSREKYCPRPLARVARALWPCKTALHLACIANSTERAAKNWLSGEQDPPAIVIAAIVAEITADFH